MINIYSWKAILSIYQLIPAVISVFQLVQTFTMKKQPLLFFSPCQYFTKSHVDYQNHLGDGTWVFVTNIIADYIATDYP
jgi:hypothetical protein